MTGRIRNPWVVVAAYNEAPVVGTVVSGIRRAGYAVVVAHEGDRDPRPPQGRGGPFRLKDGRGHRAVRELHEDPVVHLCEGRP